ncbi:MAG: hypothetical protein Fur0041_03960 [Bacteroidia bacterium]
MSRLISYTILSLSFLLLQVFAFAQSKKEVKQFKIKAVTETLTTYENGKQTASYKSAYRVFDKEGNVTEDTEYNKDGSIRKRELSKYAGKEKIEEIQENNGTDDNNDDGPAKKYKKTTWKYNSSGDKTEETIFDEKGYILRKTVFTYNAKGDKLSETTYDTGGRMIKKVTYTYDSKGLRTEKKIFGSGEVLQKHIKYTYTY